MRVSCPALLRGPCVLRRRAHHLGAQPPHALEPAIDIAGLALPEAQHLGVRQDQEALVAQAAHHLVGQRLGRHGAVGQEALAAGLAVGAQQHRREHALRAQAADMDAGIAMGVALNQGYGQSPTTVSTLHLLQLLTWAKHQRQRGDVYFHIKGGNQRMPEAMAKALQEPVEMSCPVFGLHDHGKGVTVATAHGEFDAKRVLVSVPCTALRHIKITPEPPRAQRLGIDTLTYSTSTQVLFRVDDAYWEQDGLPPTIWSDTEIGQLLAFPYGPAGATQSASIWISGADAFEADKLSHSALVERSMAVLKRIRPRAAKALTPIKVFSWQQERYTGGTWASWAPGQITAFANQISQIHGRMHFAGEHTARLERGMEGAMESADRAVLEILERTL